MTSALTGVGAPEVLEAAAAHLIHLDASGQRTARRTARIRSEIQARMEQKLAAMTAHVLSSAKGAELLNEAETGTIPPTEASSVLLRWLLGMEPAPRPCET
jgi:putative protein kinase ArgK-like GTPase of G3E family